LLRFKKGEKSFHLERTKISFTWNDYLQITEYRALQKFF